MNDFIELLKNQSVRFHLINETSATEIMLHEYSYYTLMEYSVLFPAYNSSSKHGFVDLDFSDLYSLAILDEKLRYILVLSVLDIERIIKTAFVSDIYKVNAENSILQEYMDMNADFISRYYSEESNDSISNQHHISDMYSWSLDQFINIVHFGTFVHLMRFFYSTYANAIYNKDYAPFERHLDSVRRLRNHVAHCNSLLSLLAEEGPTTTDAVASYLGKNGIKSRTLRTNFSKPIIRDFCHFLHLYFNIDSTFLHENFPKTLYEFLNIDCRKHSSRLKSNNILLSSYNFVFQVLKIYYKSYNNS